MGRKKKKTDKEKLDKIRKGARREAMIEAGVYNIHKPKVVKDKKRYDRKRDKRVRGDEE